MNKRIWRVLLVAASAAFVTTAVVLPFARAQAPMAATYVPLGVAASGSGSGSMAWFHQPSSGAVVACQSAAASSGTVSGIQCVKAQLP